MKAQGTFLWASSIALSWLWGLGLFFSVQISVLFGFTGLLCFAIPNALGLILFGMMTQDFATREQTADKFEARFLGIAKHFRANLIFYQVLAVALSVFALLKYGILPTKLPVAVMSLGLIALLFLGIALYIGDRFDIKGIKWVHFYYLLGILLCMGIIYATVVHPNNEIFSKGNYGNGLRPVWGADFWSYFIPMGIGFLVGPWLDLQQWQRAVQIRREHGSIRNAYILGAVIFFSLIVAHGLLAMWVLELPGQPLYDTIKYGNPAIAAKSIITKFLLSTPAGINSPAVWAYLGFVALAIISTLDSAYLATRWFLQENIKTSDSPLLNIVPKSLLTSPLPYAVLAGFIGLVTALMPIELEYYMIFFATFFVGFDLLLIFHFQKQYPQNRPHMEYFAVALMSLAVFALGYFSTDHSWFMIIGSLMPVVHALLDYFTAKLPPMAEVKDRLVEFKDSVSKEVANIATSAMGTVTKISVDGEGVMHSPTYMEGKWFVYTFTTTYADTNSVGNVYFANYAIFVGKTRELFFNYAMPNFDVKTTQFFILTREFSHKFIRETIEFQKLVVKLRVASYNRKFVELEHIILDAKGATVGKGKQTLMFVSVGDYKLLDIPGEVLSCFLRYA